MERVQPPQRDNAHSADRVNCNFVTAFKINSASLVKVDQNRIAEIQPPRRRQQHTEAGAKPTNGLRQQQLALHHSQGSGFQTGFQDGSLGSRQKPRQFKGTSQTPVPVKFMQDPCRRRRQNKLRPPSPSPTQKHIW